MKREERKEEKRGEGKKEKVVASGRGKRRKLWMS